MSVPGHQYSREIHGHIKEVKSRELKRVEIYFRAQNITQVLALKVRKGNHLSLN